MAINLQPPGHRAARSRSWRLRHPWKTPRPPNHIKGPHSQFPTTVAKATPQRWPATPSIA